MIPEAQNQEPQRREPANHGEFSKKLLGFAADSLFLSGDRLAHGFLSEYVKSIQWVLSRPKSVMELHTQ